MICPNLDDLTQELKELINLTSFPNERKASIFNECHHFLFLLNDSIQKLEDSSSPHMQRIKKITNSKEALTPYINNLRKSEEYFMAIDDHDTASIIRFDRSVLEEFQRDSITVLNWFADANNAFLAQPEASYNIQFLRNKKNLSTDETSYLLRAVQSQRLLKVAKLFEGYGVTSNMLVISASIYMFKTFIQYPGVQKYQLKEKLQYLLNPYRETIQIRPDEMDSVYYKTTFNQFPVFAYSTATDRKPSIDIQKIDEYLKSKNSFGSLKQQTIRNRYLEKDFKTLKKGLFGSSI